ncbi:MAG: protein kinase [Candidatus Promineifilaceae bacterium]|nr:protein kinase [Candidatus Promineifilaceae bacterium]
MVEQRLQQYRIEERVRQGSLGTVYRAFDVEAERPVWLELLPDEMARDDAFRRRFLEVMEAASGLSHRSIAPPVGYGEADGRLYLATEPPAGRPLSAHLDALSAPAGRVPLNTLLTLVGQAAEALAHAHERGVVHGGVSPDTVFLARKNEGGGIRPVLVNFGAAWLLFATGKEEAESVARRLPYMPPEAIRRRPLDNRSDIYSLGMLLYRLLAGRLPFAASSLKEAARSYLQEKPPSPQSYYAEIPGPAAAVVQKAIAKDPGRRFQDADEMVRALREAAQGESGREELFAAATPPEMEGAPVEQPAGTALTHAASQSGQLALFVGRTALEMAPGERDILEVEVVNRGGDVDHVTLEVSGLPRAWVSMAQEFVRLTPGVQTSLPVTIEVPDESSSRAGEYPFELVARSTRNERETASVSGVLEVESLVTFDMALEPPRVRHGRRCRVQIRNQGNRDTRFQVRGQDPEGRVRFEGARTIGLEAGKEASVPLIVTARERPLVGRSASYPFAVEVRPPDADAQRVAGEVIVPPRLPTGCVVLTVGSFLIMVLVVFWAVFGMGGVSIQDLFTRAERARPLPEFLEENWGEGFEVTSLTHDGLAWALVMSQVEDGDPEAVDGVWRVAETFPTAFVSQQQDAGYAIDSLAHGAGLWAVLMSRRPEPIAQRWYTSDTFPDAIIDEQVEEGFYVTDLTYGGGQWAVVMSEIEATGQRWEVGTTFPQDFIDEQWDEGYRVTDVAYGEGQWAVVAAAVEDGVAEQEVLRQAEFPRLYIREQWIQGLDVTELAYGNGEWVVVTVSGGEDVRQRWHATSRFLE